MERKFLVALGLEKEVIDKVLDQHSREIGRQKTAAESAKEEATALKAQLEEATGKIEEFRSLDVDGIRKSADEWKSKYEAETEALRKQLEDKEYSYTLKEAVAGLRFSSESAKRTFVADLTEKRPPINDGKLLGLDDFVKEYRERDPGAFAPEKEEKTPVAVRGTWSGAGTSPDAALRAAFGLKSEKGD